MICGNQVDDTIPEALPELLAILPASNGRRTFAKCRSIGDFLGGEMQVVRTRLDSDRKPFSARSAQYVEPFGGRQVDNVQAEAEFTAQREQEAKRGEFRLAPSRQFPARAYNRRA